MTAFAAATYAARLSRLQDELAAREIDVLAITVNSDLLYYTGSVNPLYLLVPASGEPLLLARKGIERIGGEVPFLPCRAFTSGSELRELVSAGIRGPARKLAYTLDTTSYATVQRLQQLFPGAKLVDWSWEMRTLRMVKSAEEIDAFRRAAEVPARLPEILKAHFCPGITELELGVEVERALRLGGHSGLIRCRREGIELSGGGVLTGGVRSLAGTKFDGVCAGVGLSPAAPYGATTDVIAPGEPINIDFACVVDGYHLDQTRIACWGEPSAEIRTAYDHMSEILDACLDAMRPGVAWEAIFTLAAARAEALGYADVFMGAGRDQVKFIGHGVGLELDEPPFLAPRMPYPLEAGMVIAVEPKVALPGIGVVGIEDTVLVTPEGTERITRCPREIIVL